MDAITGQDYVVTFHLLSSDGEYITPSAGSVKYSVFDNSGTVMGGLSNVAIADNEVIENAVSVTVAGISNTLAVGKSFEQRTVELVCTQDGRKYRFVKYYYVTARLNYRCDPMEVLGLLGLKEGEIWADQVDFVKAYFELNAQFGGTVLTTALASGTIDQIRANEAILVKAALDFATALELKALRKAGGDALSYQRFEKVDFIRVKQDLQQRLDNIIGNLDSSTILTPTAFQVVTGVNPITGV